MKKPKQLRMSVCSLIIKLRVSCSVVAVVVFVVGGVLVSIMPVRLGHFQLY